MNGSDGDRLYNLLPAVYRIADSVEGEPLQSLLAVIEAEAHKLEADIDGLYANWFIETCDEWVVPYIGDLLGVQGLNALEAVGFSQRAYVANTLAYRRRKGTAAVLEQLARDVTGWPARAVEFFQLLATTQHINHVRLQNVRTPDLRDTNRLELLDGPFDTIPHTGEVRRVAVARGRYNIPNIGLFLWRLQSYPVDRSVPRPAADPPDGRYFFNSLGYDAPLFTRFLTETEITQLADETNVPGPIRLAAFYDDLTDYRRRYTTVPPADRPGDTAFYGPNRSLNVETLDTSVNPPLFSDAEPIRIVCMDLSAWERPPAGLIGVDVRRGRLAFPAAEVPVDLRVNHAYGFSADIGGGPYERRRPPARLRRGQASTADDDAPDTVAQPNALGRLIQLPSPGVADLAQALAAWDPATMPRAVIQLDDNETYVGDVTVDLGALGERALVIQAANQMRPTLIGDITVIGGTGSDRLRLDGLLIAGALDVQADLAQLDITHCTLVPGRRLDPEGQPQEPTRASLTIAATAGPRPINDRLRVTIERCIVGPLRLPEKLPSLTVRDSIIDAPARRLSALVSGHLSPFPDLTLPIPNASPTVNVTIGAQGPHAAVFAGVPANLAQAREQLQAAIRAAHPSPAFAAARVITAANRLVILPGAAGNVQVTAAPGDPTATRLKLEVGSARPVFPLIVLPRLAGEGAEGVEPFRSTTLRLVHPDETPHAATLPAAAEAPGTLSQARAQFQAAIRGAHPSPAFAQALVATLDDRLVILPGLEAAELNMAPATVDDEVLTALALADERPALASSVAGEAGPPTTLERVTILGVVRVRELTLASEVIFTSPVVAQRRQAGCVRFSYVPPGSQTPQRFRCQPDLQIASETEEAAKQAQANSLPFTDTERAAIRDRVRAWLVPAYRDTRYGQPDYVQLARSCPAQITTGAEDGAEMGVFNLLKQPQREANLRTALDEYLRFGLEAGIIYVT